MGAATVENIWWGLKVLKIGPPSGSLSNEKENKDLQETSASPAHCSISHDCQDTDTAYLSVRGRMDSEEVIHISGCY